MIKEVTALTLAFMMLTNAAEAKRHRHYKNHHNHNQGQTFIDDIDHAFRGAGRMIGSMAKPSKWCGWWMRTQFGGGPEYNVARNWARRGSSSHAQVGAVVVWPHHVGIITGRASNGQFIVKSGNDSNRVRERPRSVAGAIAFRML